MPYVLNSSSVVAVIGAGSMGAGIAQLAAQSGHAVRLHDAQSGAAAAAVVRIAADLEGAVKRGRLSGDDRQAILQRIEVADSLEALAGSDLIVEAIFERVDVKQGLFRKLEVVVGPDAVFATNTSSISITAVAQGLKHSSRLIGWHFFNPATRMKLVEIIPGVETEPALVPMLHVLSASWGKTSVDAPNAPGFIVNRVARPYYAEGLRLLAERIAPAAAIDRLLREAGGFALGPFELMDLIGLDVNLAVTESVFQATAYDPRYAPHLIQQEMVRSGRLGRKSGQGFYAYGKDAAQPTVTCVDTTGTPPLLRHSAHANLLQPLLDRLGKAGVQMSLDESLPNETIAFGDVHVALTDGRTASERSVRDGRRKWLLLDLARDFSITTLVGATASPRAAVHLPELAAVLAPAGIALLALADVAGLVVMRAVCCLGNEAADVMTWTPTSATDIDIAMCLGTAYPVGPLAWADAIGIQRVVDVLANLQAHYGEVRYRRAPALTRAHHSGVNFHG